MKALEVPRLCDGTTRSSKESYGTQSWEASRGGADRRKRPSSVRTGRPARRRELLVKIQIPGVRAGGNVPVPLQVGNAAAVADAFGSRSGIETATCGLERGVSCRTWQ